MGVRAAVDLLSIRRTVASPKPHFRVFIGRGFRLLLNSASASRLLLIAVAFTFALLGPCGCARRSVSNDQKVEAAYHDVVDDTGQTVRLPVRPKRIVSLAPSLTEIVFVVGAGSRLVGDTSYCDYPEEAKKVTRVGDTLNPNIELIIGLKPDLVLISTASQLEAFSKQLDQQKIPVYISDPHDLNGVLTSIVKIGELLDEGAKGKDVANLLTDRARNVESRVDGSRPVRVFYQVSAEPLYTAGRDSFVTDLIKRAGGESVTATVPGAWPRFSNESALAANPDAIIIPTGDSMAGGSAVTVSDALKTSAAVRNRRVYFINGDLLSRPGPRLVEGLEEMAKDLHP
jgi:cobalamin transport system substrate-binding protein